MEICYLPGCKMVLYVETVLKFSFFWRGGGGRGWWGWGLTRLKIFTSYISLLFILSLAVWQYIHDYIYVTSFVLTNIISIYGLMINSGHCFFFFHSSETILHDIFSSQL